MSFDAVMILFMALGLVMFIGEPLVRRVSESGQNGAEDSELDQLILQKETVYTAIGDLDFDFRTDKVDDQDYTALRDRLEDEAIQQLRQKDGRCLLVIHGRGRNSEDGPVLKDRLFEWLAEAPVGPQVMAFCSATGGDGGVGATYVLLRRER